MRQLCTAALQLSALQLFLQQRQRFDRRLELELSHFLPLADVATEVSANGFHCALTDDAQFLHVQLGTLLAVTVRVMSVLVDG